MGHGIAPLIAITSLVGTFLSSLPSNCITACLGSGHLTTVPLKIKKIKRKQDLNNTDQQHNNTKYSRVLHLTQAIRSYLLCNGYHGHFKCGRSWIQVWVNSKTIKLVSSASLLSTQY